MSKKGLSTAEDVEKIFKKASNKHYNSGELDVFEASRYFSGYNEPAGSDHRSYAQKYNNDSTGEENRRRWGLGRGRISLDLPFRSSEPVHNHQDHYVLEKRAVLTRKEKMGDLKHKQPSSPGWKIASFLNNLFFQVRSKKNKSKSELASLSTRDEEESLAGWRRRRRSSISHFLMSSSRSSNTTSTTTTTNSSSKSLYSSSSSGFRTPPPCLNPPTKNYKEFLNHNASNQVEMDKKSKKDLPWFDEKIKLIETFSREKRIWSEDHSKKITNDESFAVDNGAESDSSSDLFELQNYDLPVYETTKC